jgi:hypothetical protein
MALHTLHSLHRIKSTLDPWYISGISLEDSLGEARMARHKTALGVWVDPSLLEQVNRVAGECHLSRSELVRGWLVEGIKAHALRSKRIAAMSAYKGEPDL